MRLGPFHIPLTLRQSCFYLMLTIGLVLFFLWDWKVCYTLLTFVVCGFYGLIIVFRLSSMTLAGVKGLLGRPDEHVVGAGALKALDSASLPVYTILVPMYKEPEVAQKIAETVTQLDYPVEKLDVKLLLEQDDPQTRSKIEAVMGSLPPCVEVIVCPNPNTAAGEPRTKPRACNWGLERARGEYLVIYDAEDHPDGDQLKKAVATFRKLAEQGQDHVVCLQAKLNYFNARQNSLTQFFTLEYSGWFDLFLPGLHAFRIPIPLGGTSNHFKTGVLRSLGGWDPFNVTEDCDLGIRLARRGYVTEVLDSTTWEEANSRVGNWIRQRSRWIKGYFQTHLVHARDAIIPPFLLSGFFCVFAWLLAGDLENAALFETHNYSRIAFYACVFMAFVSAGLGSWALLERFGLLGRRSEEGRLRLYDAFTFRLTVGGHALMLVLNLLFWSLSALYLLREPIAQALPAATDQIHIKALNDETPREILSGWTLYYAKVTEELYRGHHIWNTGYAWFERRLSWDQARRIFGAIDRWSLMSQLLYPVVIGLFLANFVFVLLGFISCAKRRLWSLWPYALLAPFYWVLISLAAYKGAWQLMLKPWFWEKTIHGFATPPSMMTSSQDEHSDPAPDRP